VPFERAIVPVVLVPSPQAIRARSCAGGVVDQTSATGEAALAKPHGPTFTASYPGNVQPCAL
jgi:hypothetical protein